MRYQPILGCAFVVVLAGCSHVFMPADSAPPASVLEAYLTAVVANDCSTAHALETKDFGAGHDCGMWHITSFGSLVGPATPRDGEEVFSTAVTTQGGDMPDGGHLLFFDLIRQPGGSWRVAGGGTGP